MSCLDAFLPPVGGEALAEMARGYQRSLVLAQAFELGIFDKLAAGPRRLEELAAEFEVLPERLKLLLDALAALGLLEKEGEAYGNSLLSQTFLCSQSCFCQKDLLRLQLAPERRRQWERISDWLKGDTMRRPGNPGEVFNPSFIHAMAQATLSHKGFTATVELVAEHLGQGGARRLLDLGGGHGLYAIALKELKPELEVTVFDLPHVEEVTRGYARRYGTEVNFLPGNFHADELPGEQDIVLTFDVFYGPPAKTREVLAKVYRALKPGGYLFTKHWFLDDTRTRPERAALFALLLALGNPASHVCTCREMTEMLTELGLAVKGEIPVGDSASTIIIARKEGE
ncbi:class I SAM-dependent methyltransferase [Desulfothermobacter acidiphilus]|uniref:class I SAM-dependent methyltransferase n=1 Tax=Desulfothermobacter acidiphilus TaxID=1938353 RepID=UPI003F8B07A6